MPVHLLLQPDLDQRLIRNVSRIRGDLNRIQQMLRQSQRDRLRRRLQLGERCGSSLAPVEVFRGIVLFPERPFGCFAGEFRNGLSALAHKLLSLSWTYPEPKSRGSLYRRAAG